MRIDRSFPFLAFLLLLLPLPARADLTPVGAPLVIADRPFCSFTTELEVIPTPKGAFEVVWVDETDFAVNGLRFARNLQASGPPRALLPLHGGLDIVDFVGSWAGRYELVINVLDFGEDPSDPGAAYRLPLNVEGQPVKPPLRVVTETDRFVQLAPAAGGDSLFFRNEPPFFGPPACPSRGLLAHRINGNGVQISDVSRVTRRASPWSGSLEVERLPNDTFVAVYSTCFDFIGLVGRRLNADGAPVGGPINLPLPARINGDIMLAARSGTDFAVAARVFDSTNPAVNGAYTRAVVNGQVFGPTLISGPSPVSDLFDLAASPDGGYLLLFTSGGALFAQELDAQGVQQGTPLAIPTEDEFNPVNGAVASLPNGRWVVVTRTQRQGSEDCSERLRGFVLAGG